MKKILFLMGLVLCTFTLSSQVWYEGTVWESDLNKSNEGRNFSFGITYVTGFTGHDEVREEIAFPNQNGTDIANQIAGFAQLDVTPYLYLKGEYTRFKGRRYFVNENDPVVIRYEKYTLFTGVQTKNTGLVQLSMGVGPGFLRSNFGQTWVVNAETGIKINLGPVALSAGLDLYVDTSDGIGDGIIRPYAYDQDVYLLSKVGIAVRL